jgi:hypothetical protein
LSFFPIAPASTHILPQESYFTYSSSEEALVDHNIHFRAGIGADGAETFTPRTVIYDLKGGFGSLRKINALYDATEGDATAGLWDGSTLTQQNQAIEPSRYQALLDQGLPTFQIHDADVRYWSDFNRVFYHPRSAVQLNEYELGSRLMPFDNWSTGEELFRDLDKEFDLLDRDVRPFVEECDQMQGMQMFTGSDDAWGGFSARYLDGLRDEYGKTSIWVWGNESNRRVSRQETLQRSANAARSMAAFGQQASAYARLASLPPTLPAYINLEPQSKWVTSALQCAAMESALLPTRLLHDPAQHVSLSLLESILNSTGNQRVFDLRMSSHDHGVNGVSNGINGVVDDLHSEDDRLGIDFAPDATNHTHDHTFSRVSVGRSRDSVIPTNLEPDERMRRRLNEETVEERFSTQLTFPQLDSFPDTLFDGRGGLELATALSTNSSMKDRILRLRDSAQRGLASDERENIYNDLSEIATSYGFGWESGSDSGEDA